MLAFLTSSKLGHLSADKNVLTDQELERWAEMQKTHPETIMSGDLLEQALQLIKSEEGQAEAAILDQMTDDELERLVSDRREQLQVGFRSTLFYFHTPAG